MIDENVIEPYIKVNHVDNFNRVCEVDVFFVKDGLIENDRTINSADLNKPVSNISGKILYE